MRATKRLLAAVKQSGFLEPGAPTGLTGLYTHRSPRAALLYTYSSTLDKLKQIPESSVYRQSTEALTKHRLAIVEKHIPSGYEAWQDRVAKYVEENKTTFERYGLGSAHTLNGMAFLKIRKVDRTDTEDDEWDGDPAATRPDLIAHATSEEDAVKNLQGIVSSVGYNAEELAKLELPPEPQLTREQIGQLESELGAGLIEEVIQVAEGEDMLVDKMVEAKV